MERRKFVDCKTFCYSPKEGLHEKDRATRGDDWWSRRWRGYRGQVEEGEVWGLDDIWEYVGLRGSFPTVGGLIK